MNFFGHACVAAWFSSRGPFVLGSMLPDLASALRLSPPSSAHAELRAGVDLHHATDRVFHATDAFNRLEQEARAALGSAGVSKGPRRALAHVGVEFLLDEQLASGGRARVAYESALAFGVSAGCRAALEWRAEGAGERFAALCERLGRVGLGPRGDEALAARLAACLAGRPRLELAASERATLEPWLAALRPAVVALTPALLGELASALGAPDATASSCG